MEIYLAPMEGITGATVRNAFAHNFANIDKYYTPFISSSFKLSAKTKRDIRPENNAGPVVPQIMSVKTEEVTHMMDLLRPFGYSMLNINLGCPSGTVTAKGRGSGFLQYPEELLRFLDSVYSTCDFPVSIKTRIGYSDPHEWEKLLDIYARFPIAELTIHPRTRMEFYTGEVHLDAFAMAYDRLIGSQIPLCYNGDINTYADYKKIMTRFPKVERVMIGRGLLRNPALAEILANDGAYEEADIKERFKAFLYEIYNNYIAQGWSEKDSVSRMKELLSFLLCSFAGADDYRKQVQRAQSWMELKVVFGQVLAHCELIVG